MKGLLRFVSKCSYHKRLFFLIKNSINHLLSFFVRKFMFFPDWYRENYRLNQKASDIKARSYFLTKLSTLQEIFSCLIWPRLFKSGLR